MNKLLRLLCLCIVLCALLQPLGAYAAAPLDTEAQTSLTLYYQKDGKCFPELTISVHRIAEAFPDGTFSLIEPFSAYPVRIHDIMTQEEWRRVSSTLSAYITADQIQPDAQAQTDKNGTALFQGLKTGLYLVREVIADNGSGTYIFNHFLVYLPTPSPDGSYDYDVEAKPKCIGYAPKNEYKVVKLWQDAGNTSHRPKQISIEIYKDGILQETKLLSPENNWSYTWSVYDGDEGIWSVVERDVPKGYTVSVSQNGTVFTVVNASDPQEEKPPQTGDSFSPLPWVLALCLSGCAMLLLGFYGRRRR